MKIAYIAPYKDGTGYANAAISQILALDSVGIEVVPRSVGMTRGKASVPDRILELENNSVDNGIDAVIQHNMPSEFVYKKGVRNIGLFFYETNSIVNTGWDTRLRMMDDIWVSSWELVKTLERNKILSTKINIATNPEVKTDVEKLNFSCPEGATIFYTISEINNKKNISSLLAAYNAEFSSSDNVLLVVKGHFPGVASGRDGFRQMLDSVRRGCNRFSNPKLYPRVIHIDGFIPDADIDAIHQSCDVYVSASCGEAWCIPAIDALKNGNYVIAAKNGSLKDYIGGENGILVDTYETNVFEESPVPLGLFTSDERWGKVSVPDLSKQMRLVQKNINQIKENGAVRHKYVNDHFRYEVVGKQLKNILET